MVHHQCNHDLLLFQFIFSHMMLWLSICHQFLLQSLLKCRAEAACSTRVVKYSAGGKIIMFLLLWCDLFVARPLLRAACPFYIDSPDSSPKRQPWVWTIKYEEEDKILRRGERRVGEPATLVELLKEWQSRREGRRVCVFVCKWKKAG